MHDPAVQIRSYFDAVTQRVTADDVRVDVVVRLQPAPKRRLRAVPAFAAGFGLVLVSLGGVAATMFGETATRQAGSGATPGASAATGTWWWMLPGVAGLSVLVAAVRTAVSRRVPAAVTREGDPAADGSMSEGGDDMQTMERTAPPFAEERIIALTRRNRWLIGLVGFMVIVAGALGVWAYAASTSDPSVVVIGGGDLTAEQDQMLETLDAYLAAWVAGDGEAVAALYLPSGYLRSGDSTYFAADGSLATLVCDLHAQGFAPGRDLLRVVDGTTIYSFSESTFGHLNDEIVMSADGLHVAIHR